MADTSSFKLQVDVDPYLQMSCIHIRGVMYLDEDADLFQAKLNLAIHGTEGEGAPVVRRFLVVDMKELGYISTRGLRMLSIKAVRLLEVDGAVYLVAPNEAVVAKFRRTLGGEFVKLFEIAPNFEAAQQEIGRFVRFS